MMTNMPLRVRGISTRGRLAALCATAMLGTLAVLLLIGGGADAARTGPPQTADDVFSVLRTGSDATLPAKLNEMVSGATDSPLVVRLGSRAGDVSTLRALRRKTSLRV
jgi:hypothetical protein